MTINKVKCWGHSANHAEGCEKKLPHGPHIFPEPPGPVEGSIKQVMDYLAENSCEFYIEHNPHHGMYQTVMGYLRDDSLLEGDYLEWLTEHFETNPRFPDELWVIRVYPRTPISFFLVHQDNFEGAIRDAFKTLVETHEESARAANPPLPEYGPLTEEDTLKQLIKTEMFTMWTQETNQQILYGDGS